jgi:hypothetical protein
MREADERARMQAAVVNAAASGLSMAAGKK